MTSEKHDAGRAGGARAGARPSAGAPQTIADSLEELMTALNMGRRSIARVEAAERERTAELRAQVVEARRKAFERGRRAGYAKGLEDGRALARPDRGTAYAAGFAEGAALGSRLGGGRDGRGGRHGAL